MIAHQKLKNQVDLTYFSGFLSHHRKYLYVYYLYKLLTYGHQIYIIDAYHMNAPTDRFTSI